VVIGTGAELGVEVLAAGAESVLTAARASTVPWPTSASHPADGWCAVDSMRCITCLAVKAGNRARISAATPVTTGAA
jgi:hypothetical protein